MNDWDVRRAKTKLMGFARNYGELPVLPHQPIGNSLYRRAEHHSSTMVFPWMFWRTCCRRRLHIGRRDEYCFAPEVRVNGAASTLHGSGESTMRVCARRSPAAHGQERSKCDRPSRSGNVPRRRARSTRGRSPGTPGNHTPKSFCRSLPRGTSTFRLEGEGTHRRFPCPRGLFSMIGREFFGDSIANKLLTRQTKQAKLP